MGPALVPTGTPVQLELGPPFKKIRFGEPKPDVQQPLRIDTRVSTVVKPYAYDIQNKWYWFEQLS